MEAKPFDPPDPVLNSAHDVRKLDLCRYCGRFGIGLPIVKPSSRKRGRRGQQNAHTYCIVTVGGGWKALVALPQDEIDKTALSDFMALGLTLDEFNAKLAEVRAHSSECGGIPDPFDPDCPWAK